MAIKFSIGRRIGLGFAIFILLTTVAFLLTISTVSDSKSKTTKVVGEVMPSVAELKELNLLLQRSHTDISKWYYNKSFNDLDFRNELTNIITKEYPKKKLILKEHAKSWTKEENEQLKMIFSRIETLFKTYQNNIMGLLTTTDAYEDPSIYYLVRLDYEDSEVSIKTIYRSLNDLIEQKQQLAEAVKDNMLSSLDILRTIVIWLGIILMIGGILIAVFTTRSITAPIQVLKKMLLSMGLGILPTERIKPRNDEVGEMGLALNDLIQSMHHTTDFANETGAGNFNAKYTPLSKDDSLGHALLKMRDSLAENERLLEQKVIERTEEVVRQKHIIEEKQHEILDSINYAKRLQEAILPPKEFLDKHLADSFILYRPKDIVAGDFYWAEYVNGRFFVAAADSTGHGVPGAMVSVVCSNALNRTVKEFKEIETGKILDKTRELVLETFEKSASEVKDGMDISLLCVDVIHKKVYWSGANNPLWYYQNNEMKEITADKQPIGKTENPKPFTTHEIEYVENTVFYLFTDGYADQFGGPKGKKFKYKQFSNLLLATIERSPREQSQHIYSAFEEWKGDLEQVDDVCVIGVKI